MRSVPPQQPLVRCAIYTRQSVAHEDQAPELTSTFLQWQHCIRFVGARMNRSWWPVTEHFDDEGVSGTTLERPALQRLLERVTAGAIQRVVIYAVDRLTRNPAHWALLLATLRRHDVGLAVVQFDLEDVAGALRTLGCNVAALFAGFEHDLIHARQEEALAARRAAGLRSSGRIPYGYRSDPETRQLVLDPEEAPTLRAIFALAGEGQTPAAILDAILEGRMVVGGRGARRAWSRTAVLNLLRNPTYQWRLPDGAPARHPALVDADTFTRIQGAIRARRSREPQPRVPSLEPDPFLLRGLVRCPVCDGTMTTATRGRASTIRDYRCCQPRCAGSQCRAPHLEERVLARLRQLRRERGQVGAGGALRPGDLFLALDIWQVLTPANQHHALASVVAAVRWKPFESTVDLQLHPGLAITPDTLRIQALLDATEERFRAADARAQSKPLRLQDRASVTGSPPASRSRR